MRGGEEVQDLKELMLQGALMLWDPQVPLLERPSEPPVPQASWEARSQRLPGGYRLGLKDVPELDERQSGECPGQRLQRKPQVGKGHLGNRVTSNRDSTSHPEPSTPARPIISRPMSTAPGQAQAKERTSHTQPSRGRKHGWPTGVLPLAVLTMHLGSRDSGNLKVLPLPAFPSWATWTKGGHRLNLTSSGRPAWPAPQTQGPKVPT